MRPWEQNIVPESAKISGDHFKRKNINTGEIGIYKKNISIYKR